jgi:23S rRNA (adenine2503-C2)-methyltransferase
MDIGSMTMAELCDWVESKGQPKFRAKQIYQWIHKKLVESPEEMTNLPQGLREEIKNQGFSSLSVVTRLESAEDGTNKFLFKLSDGNVIESVLMRYKHGNSVCISSQVGCRMGCRFCASTIGGLVRDLTAYEMLSQIYMISKISGERVSNVVVMGTGEPLDNYDNLVRFIKMLTDEDGLNISQRNVTVSSCGLVPKIKELADLGLSITFALSLHAPNDEERQKLMPIAKKYSIQEVMEACDYYFEKTGRRITFEYSLVKDVNDREYVARELARLLKGKNCHVNLIPVNPIKERDYERATGDAIDKFKGILEKNNITVTVRRSMGKDIDAACGQLRRKYQQQNM